MAKNDINSVPIQKLSGGTPYARMTRGHKIRFVLKVVVSVLTFGFAFPNVMDD